MLIYTAHKGDLIINKTICICIRRTPKIRLEPERRDLSWRLNAASLQTDDIRSSIVRKKDDMIYGSVAILSPSRCVIVALADNDNLMVLKNKYHLELRFHIPGTFHY